MEEHQLLLVSLGIAFVGVWAAIAALAIGEQLSKARQRRLGQSGTHAVNSPAPGPHYSTNGAGPAGRGDQPLAAKRSRKRRSSSAS